MSNGDWQIVLSGQVISPGQTVPICGEKQGRLINAILVLEDDSGGPARQISISKLIGEDCL